jgi:hypothetical protein
MTPENRNSPLRPLLDNGSPTHISTEIRIRGKRLGTESAFHVNGINKQFPWIRARLYKEPCREELFSRRGFVRQSSFKAAVEEGIDSYTRTKSVTVEEKTLVV